MKKKLLLLLISPLFLTAQECCYEDTSNFYVKVFGGANFLQNSKTNGNKASYQTGYIISGSLGYAWCYGLRVEAEYAYRRNGIKKIHFVGQGSSKHGHFQNNSCMANLLWDFCAICNLRPFIGAGVGYDFQSLHSSNSRIVFHQKWNDFAFQVMAGFAYPIFCNTDLSLEYRFHQGGSHFYNHALGVGLAYKFCF